MLLTTRGRNERKKVDECIHNNTPLRITPEHENKKYEIWIEGDHEKKWKIWKWEEKKKKIGPQKLEISYSSMILLFFCPSPSYPQIHIPPPVSLNFAWQVVVSDTRAIIQFAGFFLAGFGIFSYAFGLGARLLSLDFPFALLLGPCPQFLLCVWPWPSSSLSSSEEESLSSLEDSSYARGRR